MSGATAARRQAFSPETRAAHRARWYARVTPNAEYPDGKIPRNRYMAGRDWGWDVKCSCGWETRTGGAIEIRVAEEVWWHRWQAENETTR